MRMAVPITAIPTIIIRMAITTTTRQNRLMNPAITIPSKALVMSSM